MISELVDRMKSTDPAVRKAASEELHAASRSGQLGLSEATALLRAATGQFPPGEYVWQDVSTDLVYAARNIVRDKDAEGMLSTVRDTFERLTPKSKSACLQILTMSHSAEAAALYVRFLDDDGPALAKHYAPPYPRSAGPQVASALFPSVLRVIRHPPLVPTVLAMLLDFREAGLVPADIARTHEKELVRCVADELAQIRAHQRPTGLGWRDEDPYAAHRHAVSLLFDLAGVLDCPPLLDAVGGSGDLADPRLRRFRAVSLLRHGRAVTDAELEWIARSPRDRYWLFNQLHSINMPERLPVSCRDQLLLAEGNMVDWLCFGTELGREPDEIELLRKETRRRSSARPPLGWIKKRKEIDYFFFKFRVTEEHWSKERGWMVGMAGGFLRHEQPTLSHDGSTFSKFASLEERAIQDHVADYLDDAG